MQKFLSKVAQELLQKHSSQLENCTIVLPSKRAAVFLRKEISTRTEQSIWSPNVVSIETFISQKSELIQVEKFELLTVLYQVHQEIETIHSESFSDFISWGNILLADFNEIDRYLINAGDLFGFLTEVKVLENWNPGEENLTEFQSNYLSFWGKLFSYYTLFKEKLKSKSWAYQGMIFRSIADQLILLNIIEERQYHYFVGFNALTKAEEKILDHYCENEKGEFLYDIDSYYLNDSKQEAGMFLRRAMKRDPEIKWVDHILQSNEKEIHIYPVNGSISQAKMLGEIVRDLKEKRNQEIALVLSEEQMLLPVLEALPNEEEGLNVTMSYPLEQSMLYDFFGKLIRLKIIDNSDSLLQTSSIISILNHGIWKFLNQDLILLLGETIKDLKDSKQVYAKTSQLKKLENALGMELFSSLLISHQLKEFIAFSKLLKESSIFLKDAIEMEMLYQFHSIFTRLETINNEHPALMDQKSLLQLFIQIIATESIPFVGEPLTGTQVMGVLETRCLDFESVVISNLNEGILPAGKKQNSFIPYDIKRKFELPSYKEKDAIFAYHFYRLITRAKNVHLLYNNSVEGLNNEGKSRFLMQIQHELYHYNPKIKIIEHQMQEQSIQNTQIDKSILLDENLKGKIKDHLKKGISASAINTYINCPLNYYHRYLLGIKEEESIEDIFDPSLFGSLVHKALEDFYRPMIGTFLNSANLIDLINELNQLVESNIFKHFKTQKIEGGLVLLAEVVKSYVKRVVEHDINELKNGNKIRLIDLELQLESSIQMIHKGEKLDLLLIGIIDRVDELNGKMRVIDYKTGTVDKKLDFNLEAIFDNKHAKQIQLMHYYQLIKTKYQIDDFDIGIISPKNEEINFLPLESVENPQELAVKFYEVLIDLMLNSNEKFKHNVESEYCDFC